jgi:hypothetical protein
MTALVKKILIETSTMIHRWNAIWLNDPNEGESDVSFCHQEAALVPDMFCNFYLVKNLKIVYNLATTEAREKNKCIFEILRILEIFWWMFD